MIFNYKIKGMRCVSCIDKIKTALSSKVEVVEVSLHPPVLRIQADTAPSLNELNNDLSKVGNYTLSPLASGAPNQPVAKQVTEANSNIQSYYPIFLIASYIIGVAFVNNVHAEGIYWQGFMNQFMAGFFLVFSAFKLLDIKGFAEGYATYDLLAKRWHTYGLIYPFIELGLGILYLGSWFPNATDMLTIIIMGFSSIGVINSLLKHQKIRCACLGTILNVPLSSITLIEDLSMVALALLSFVMRNPTIPIA